jgi:hypothetical protein
MILWALVLLVVFLGLSFFVPLYLTGLLVRLSLGSTYLEALGADGVGACFMLVYVLVESKRDDLNGRPSINEQ